MHALIGYRQGGDPKTGQSRGRSTARSATAERLAALLTAQGMNTLPTHKHAANYRGRDAKRLNQWFNHLGYGFNQVESIQLEIRESGFRDSNQNAVRTGGMISRALSGLARKGESKLKNGAGEPLGDADSVGQPLFA